MIYFLSDIHLGAGQSSDARRVELALCRWLDTVACDATAIYLMGDVFDFWFEYHRVVPQGFVRVLGRLADMVDRGVEVHLFIGNHDMWCGEYFTKECGIKLHLHPEIVRIGGHTLHLAHGDNMNISGQPMLRLMNTIFRSSTARVLFRWLVHPDLALKFGQWWSGKSRKNHSKSHITVADLGFLKEYAVEHHARHGEVDCYIFGHMHLAHDCLMDGFRVMFLSDWSDDVAHYIRLDEAAGLTMEKFQIR